MSNQWDYERITSEMKKDIEAAFGSSVSKEIDNAIGKMSSKLQENFSEGKENPEINRLKQLLNTKDAEIKELSARLA